MERVAVTVILTSPFAAEEPVMLVFANAGALMMFVVPVVGFVELSVTI